MSAVSGDYGVQTSSLDGGEESNSKRRKVAAPRRALSCTECKRRRTKCSALGKTPCDSCVKRGRPEDCVWEGVSAAAIESVSSSPYALASDLAALREEVEALRRTVDARVNDNHQEKWRYPPGDIISPRTARLPGPLRMTSSTSTSMSAPTPVNMSTSSTPVEVRHARVEKAAAGLEHLIIGPLPGSNPQTDHLAFSSTRVSAGAWSLTASERAGILLSEALQMLPNSETTSWLLAEYIHGPMQKGWHVIDTRKFMLQHAEFEALPLDKRNTVDPTWLALYLMILALAIKFNNQPQLLGYYSIDVLEQLPETLYIASVNALEAGNFLAVPKITHIQVSILYVLFLFHYGDSVERNNVALRHLDSAITSAQWLKLDLLDDPSNTPLDDPALSGLPSEVSLELCKRLFHTLSFMDGTIQKRPGVWRIRDAPTPLPRNYKDIFNAGDSECPSYEHTEASLARIGSSFASMIRLYHQSSDLTYDKVVEYDRALRKVLGMIPLATQELNASWMIHLVFCSIHNRLLRMHRPHLAHGYMNPEFSLSCRVSVDSARQIIEKQLLFKENPRLRPSFVKRWVLGSALVLAIDYAFGEERSREGLVMALELFEENNPADPTPNVTIASARAIRALIEVAAETRLASHQLGSEDDLQVLLDSVRTKLTSAPEPLPEFSLDLFNADLSSYDFSFLFPESGMGQGTQIL